MKDPLPSGLTQGLPFLIAADGTPAPAPAVVELLDDLRERIWAHYQRPLYDLYQQQRLPVPDDAFMPPNGNEPPF
jgi:hypothetical protein